MRRTRAAGVALLALVAVGSLAACADADTGAGAATLTELQASASASPSLSAEEQAKQESIDEAEDVLEEFRALESTVANDGYADWAQLSMDYWGADLAEAYGPWYREMAEKGRYTTGEAEQVSSKVTSYDARDTGFQEVEFTTCLDTSGLHLHEKDGSEIPLPNDTAERYVNVYTLEHQGKEGSWRVTDSAPRTDESC